MARRSGKPPYPLGLAVSLAVLTALAVLGLRPERYLLFHSAAELFSVGVACAILMLAWNTRDLADNDYLLFVGIGLFFVSAIDLVHTLAYAGTGLFPAAGANLPTQLWVGGRYLLALCMLAAPFFLTRRLVLPAAFVVFAAYVAALFASVFAWNTFPICYVPELGPTRFKVLSEYLVCCALVAGLAFLVTRPHGFSRRVVALIAGAILAMVASELAFTLYISVSGPANLVGHLLKIAAYYLLYKALVETSLRRPFELLFSGLKTTEHALRVAQHDLEDRVAGRTEDLARTVAELEREVRERLQAERLVRRREGQLRALAMELTQAEQRERRRLAHVLHDHLQQLLAVAKLRLAILRNGSEPGIPHADALDEVTSLLEQAIESARSLTAELSPAVLYEAGLSAALEWLGRQMEAAYGLHVEVSADGAAEPRTEELRVVLFECVRELLFNVVKHSGVLEARVTLASGERDSCTLAVCDRGKGFEPARAEQSQDAGGFGLFSIRERLRLLGGHLAVRSAPGEGACLTITAPREVSLPERREPPRVGPEAGAPPSDYVVGGEPPAGVIRVVLADDHEMMRTGLAGLIRNENDMEVVGEAAGGRAALDLVEQLQPDVIVMDVTMPGLGGVEATRLISERFAGVDVIGLSMHDETDMAAAMLASGARAYLTKDGPPADLLAAIRACVPHGASEREGG
jgi:signal transduction histidine kinase